MSNKKILILTIPAMGHINPILSIAKELKKDLNADIVFCSTQSFKNLIEQNGFTYNGANDFQLEEIQNCLQASTKPCDVFSATAELILNGIYDLTIKIADIIENENPSILLYDQMAVYVKYALRVLENRYVNSNINRKMPATIAYHTSYINYKDVFPNAEEKNLIMKMNWLDKIKFVFFALKLYMRTKALSRKFEIDHVSPQDDFIFADTSKLNIVFVFPEFQSRSELCEKNVKFVGACINDGPHLDTLENVKDSSLKSFLQMFKLKSPTESPYIENENILVYVSLGSLFKDNQQFYIKVINALRIFDDDIKNKKNSKLKPFNLYAIINVGEKCYEQLNENAIVVPNNIKLLPFAPQLEILKRASLFVTHCGMNSTSEAIWFGVPMICVPVTVDQPLVAHRVATELGLGILLNINTLTEEDLLKSMHKIFEDESYQKSYFNTQFIREDIMDQKLRHKLLEIIFNFT